MATRSAGCEDQARKGGLRTRAALLRIQPKLIFPMHLSNSWRISVREWFSNDDTAGFAVTVFRHGEPKPKKCPIINCGDALPVDGKLALILSLIETKTPFIVHCTSRDRAIDMFRVFTEGKRPAELAAS